MYFDDLIFIGTGSLLTNCLKHASGFEGLKLSCVEPEARGYTNLKSFCEANNIPYLLIPQKKELAKYFEGISGRKLILSIHNGYIFSASITARPNFKIINFHNSLLPAHPGRNSPSWAIYDMDERAGITWHEIVHEVDKGPIIAQVSVTIDNKMTALTLTKACVNAGFDSFVKIFPSLLDNSYKSEPQVSENKFKLHYSYETPNEGILEPGWPVRKISAFLRAMDFGALPVFDKPKFLYHDNWYRVEKYEIIDDISSTEKEMSTTDNKFSFKGDGINVTIRAAKIE
jgi:methionyl-tRNA formyltransferase